MNVASLELSKELYELSGWDKTHWRYAHNVGRTRTKHQLFDQWRLRHTPYSHLQEYIPAYDVGYLLRKLPKASIVPYHDRWQTWWDGSSSKKPLARTYGDNPEDALARLAIELFQQGVLTKEADHE